MGKQKNQKNRKNGKDFGNTDCDNLSKQLRQLGFTVKEMLGDGNCLFRALGDQYEGHSKNHIQYRLKVVEYIKSHRSEFEPFMEDDTPFDDHVKSLAEPGTYGGNDAIVAFSRIFNVTVVIHQFESPAWVIHPDQGGNSKSQKELHISYHNGDHYNSVVKISGNVDIVPPSAESSSPKTSTLKLQKKPSNLVKPEKKEVKKEPAAGSISPPRIQDLKISDDNDDASTTSEVSSKDSQVKKSQPAKPVKQTRRQILDQKKKARKADALQRKRGSVDSSSTSSVPSVPAVSSSPSLSVKTLNI